MMAKELRTYSKIVRKTRRKVIIKAKSIIEMVSPRIKAVSEKEETVSRRSAASWRTGRMYSSDIMVKRNMQPKIARIL